MKRTYSIAVNPSEVAYSAVTAPDITIPWVPSSILLIIEDLTAANTVEISFDSLNTHGKLIPGIVSGLGYTNGCTAIWLRSQAGSPLVRVVAEE